MKKGYQLFDIVAEIVLFPILIVLLYYWVRHERKVLLSVACDGGEGQGFDV